MKLCAPWKHRLRIRLDRMPFVWECAICHNCWLEKDDDGRPVGEPLPVDPTEPILAAVSKKANK